MEASAENFADDVAAAIVKAPLEEELSVSVHRLLLIAAAHGVVCGVDLVEDDPHVFRGQKGTPSPDGEGTD